MTNLRVFYIFLLAILFIRPLALGNCSTPKNLIEMAKQKIEIAWSGIKGGRQATDPLKEIRALAKLKNKKKLDNAELIGDDFKISKKKGPVGVRYFTGQSNIAIPEWKATPTYIYQVDVPTPWGGRHKFEVYIPALPDGKEDHYSLGKVEGLLWYMPRVGTHYLKELRFNPHRPASAWGTAQTTNVINIFNHCFNDKCGGARETLLHEIGHLIDFGNFESSRWSWRKAMKLDRGAVSDYAKTNATEDFAESVMEYFINPKNLKQGFPHRYEILDKIFTEHKGIKYSMAKKVAALMAAYGLIMGGIYAGHSFVYAIDSFNFSFE